MLTCDIHFCPCCEGAIHPENYAVVRFEDRVDTYMYCEFCHWGLERTAYEDGDVFQLDFRQRTEPVNFDRFLERLEEARVA